MSIDQSYVLFVHNGEAWLTRKAEELLDELSNQEERFELLIIDDGSEDGSREIMAIRHQRNPTWGWQFHPESFLTQDGHELLRRFLELGPTP